MSWKTACITSLLTNVALIYYLGLNLTDNISSLNTNSIKESKSSAPAALQQMVSEQIRRILNKPGTPAASAAGDTGPNASFNFNDASMLRSASTITTTTRIWHSKTDKVTGCDGSLKGKSLIQAHFKQTGCYVRDLMKMVHGLPKINKKIFSQNSEDGITLAIFDWIGHGRKTYLEFGVEDGKQCNSRILRERYGWKGTMWDGSHRRPAIGLYNESIWLDNVLALFRKYEISRTELDLFSLDINFADFYVLKLLLENGYRPRVIIVEINRNFDATGSMVIQEADARKHRFWPIVQYFGASALAFLKLGKAYGYTFLAMDNNAVNVFLVRDDQLGYVDVHMVHFLQQFERFPISKLGVHLHGPDNRSAKFEHVCISSSNCSSNSVW